MPTHIHWGPTIKTTTADMQPLSPEALDAEALLAFYHHGANIAAVARRLKGLEEASGNRWPSAADRDGRTRFEGNRDPRVRYPSSADPAALTTK